MAKLDLPGRQVTDCHLPTPTSSPEVSDPKTQLSSLPSEFLHCASHPKSLKQPVPGPVSSARNAPPSAHTLFLWVCCSVSFRWNHPQHPVYAVSRPRSSPSLLLSTALPPSHYVTGFTRCFYLLSVRPHHNVSSLGSRLVHFVHPTIPSTKTVPGT